MVHLRYFHKVKTINCFKFQFKMVDSMKSGIENSIVKIASFTEKSKYGNMSNGPTFKIYHHLNKLIIVEYNTKYIPIGV